MLDTGTIVNAPWPLLAVLIPLIGGLIILAKRNIPINLFNTLLFVFSILPVCFTFLMFGTITRQEVYYFSLEVVSPFSLTFQVDGLGFLVALVSSFVWFSATIFSFTYMQKHQNTCRFYAFLLITLSGTLGVALAGDFLTLLLFFEVMSLSSYVLVVHSQTSEAYDAGNTYLYMGVMGGLAVFAGAGALYYLAGSVNFEAASRGLLSVGEPVLRYVVVTLFTIGFGIKAGMLPVHIWLPKAHPVAPSPASALLSGIMIKAGAYGIIRTFSLFTPPVSVDPKALAGVSAEIFWQYYGGMGYVLIWIGVLTMFMGAAIALLQDNAKRMLAMSSISQMGYILMGVGAAAYLGSEGGMGLSGSIYHIINHAFFKSLLFLTIGFIYFKTKTINIYKLGGLWRNFPFTTVTCLIAVLAITGFPGLNGYVSKTLLHHAIEDSAIYGSHYASLITAERIFIITGAGTVAYFTKLFSNIFLGKRPENLDEVKGETLPVKISLSILSACIVALGIFPHVVIPKVITPAVSYFNIDPGHLDYVAGTDVFIAPDLFNILISFVLGGIIYFIGVKTGLFEKKLPEWMGGDFYLNNLAKLGNAIWNVANRALDGIFGLVKTIIQKVYSLVFKQLVRLDYRPGDSSSYQTVSFANLDFDLLIVIVMLTIVLSVAFYIQFLF